MVILTPDRVGSANVDARFAAATQVFDDVVVVDELPEFAHVGAGLCALSHYALVRIDIPNSTFRKQQEIFHNALEVVQQEADAGNLNSQALIAVSNQVLNLHNHYRNDCEQSAVGGFEAGIGYVLRINPKMACEPAIGCRGWPPGKFLRQLEFKTREFFVLKTEADCGICFEVDIDSAMLKWTLTLFSAYLSCAATCWVAPNSDRKFDACARLLIKFLRLDIMGSRKNQFLLFDMLNARNLTADKLFPTSVGDTAILPSHNGPNPQPQPAETGLKRSAYLIYYLLDLKATDPWPQDRNVKRTRSGRIRQVDTITWRGYLIALADLSLEIWKSVSATA